MFETKWDKVQAGQGPRSRIASMQTLESPSKQTLLHLSRKASYTTQCKATASAWRGGSLGVDLAQAIRTCPCESLKTTVSAVPESEVPALVLSLITPGGGGVQEGVGSTGLGVLGDDRVSKNSQDLIRMLWMAQ